MLALLFCVLFISFLTIRLFCLNTAQNNAIGEPRTRPFAIGEPEGCPFAIGEPEGCPFAIGEPEGCPFAIGEPEGCPFAIGEPEGCPFAIGEPSLFKSVTCIILHICIFRCLQIPDSARLRPIPVGGYLHIFYA